ncbi:MAG: hypothetical protein DF168_00447 [Candidatus Moanabacter tarae]|uniref:Nucleotidyl transferase domain-containing protein n=1 Tax=Candidatus Moanibacter tarae TaxID=2200854 RepID=A0A2Z4AEB4_9BACT|nr:MAG: hypothetical protein DF168_00447 [Candidatus Moanabacter tarae]|tara:strand:- start:4062 stop:4991 length:930 start_codon:yes stop_codon:yes gene_type:complete
MKKGKIALVVLAAGLGTRYRGLKQLEAVGPSGETILDYSVFDAMEGGFGRIVFILRREIEQEFRLRVGSRLEKKIEVTYAIQELDGFTQGFQISENRKRPWGTGHALLSVSNLVGEPFGVINADDFYGQSSFRILHDFLLAKNSRIKNEFDKKYGLVGFRLKNTLSLHGPVSRGICQCNDKGILEKIQELKRIKSTENGILNTEVKKGRRLSGLEIVSLNMWGFAPSIFLHLRDGFEKFLDSRGGERDAEYYLPECVGNAIEAGKAKVRILETSESWRGITYREDRVQVVEHIRELTEGGVYPKRLWDG